MQLMQTNEWVHVMVFLSVVTTRRAKEVLNEGSKENAKPEAWWNELEQEISNEAVYARGHHDAKPKLERAVRWLQEREKARGKKDDVQNAVEED